VLVIILVIFRYRLRQDPSENYKSFSIDEISGIITLKAELDREKQKFFDIRVEAFDLGVPTQLQSGLTGEIISTKSKTYIFNIELSRSRFNYLCEEC